MKFEISSAPVRAVIVTQPLISVPAFVMNILEPSITHSPSSARAVVRVAPASEPASGSVSPKAARRSPEASCGSHSARWRSSPKSVDRHRAERRVRGDGDRERRVDARELLDAERVGERVAARAAVGLRHGHAEQAELRRPGAARRAGSRPVRRAPRRRDRRRPRRIRAPCRGTGGARPRGRGPLSARYRPTYDAPAWTTPRSPATPTRSCATGC